MHEKIAERMRTCLGQAEETYEKDDIQTAKSAYLEAKREFTMARHDQKIFYYRSWRGMIIALFFLLVFVTGMVLIFSCPEFLIPSKLLLLAGFGGGIGGCVAVLLQAIDVDPNSEVVSKMPWYVLKPSIGFVLGMITYMGISLGFDVLSSSGDFDSKEGASVIGFLAGFFESFSKGVLARIAGQYLKEEQPSNK